MHDTDTDSSTKIEQVNVVHFGLFLMYLIETKFRGDNVTVDGLLDRYLE